MWYAVRTGMEAFSMSEMRACFASSMLFFSVRRFLQKEERERERERERGGNSYKVSPCSEFKVSNQKGNVAHSLQLTEHKKAEKNRLKKCSIVVE